MAGQLERTPPTTEQYRMAFMYATFAGTAWSRQASYLRPADGRDLPREGFVAAASICIGATDEYVNNAMEVRSFADACLHPESSDEVAEAIGDRARVPATRINAIRKFRVIRDAARTCVADIVNGNAVGSSADMVDTLQKTYIDRTRGKDYPTPLRSQLETLASLLLPDDDRDAVLARAAQHFSFSITAPLAYIPHPEMAAGVHWLAKAFSDYSRQNPESALSGSLLLPRMLGVDHNGDLSTPQTFHELNRDKKNSQLLHSELSRELDGLVSHVQASQATPETAPLTLEEIDPYTLEGQVILAKRIEAGVTAEQICAYAEDPGKTMDTLYMALGKKYESLPENAQKYSWSDAEALIKDELQHFRTMANTIMTQAATAGIPLETYLAPVIADGAAAKDYLATQNIPLVKSIAYQAAVGYGRIDQETLKTNVQVGTLGLMRAVEKYDYKYKERIKFSTYARKWIYSFIRKNYYEDRLIRLPEDVIKSANRLLTIAANTGDTSITTVATQAGIRTARAHELLTTPRAVVPYDEENTPYKIPAAPSYNKPHIPEWVRKDAEGFLVNGFSLLSKRQKVVIAERYVLDEGRTDAELARDFGVSLAVIRGERRSGLQKIRNAHASGKLPLPSSVARFIGYRE